MSKVSKQSPTVPIDMSRNGGHGSGGGGHNPSGPSAPRPMRLKVLYSLDDTLPNCLARAKEVAQVRVAHLDADTPIGFVDLKTCILNIAYSSPEILHHQGSDYSIYAFDYSEPDTPLIGLGLLSWALSLPALNGTQPPSAESLTSAQANRLITGRVQKNLLGIFGGDVKETLEVRMRLCRVPELKQADYVSHMNQFSSISKNMPQGMDVPSYWTNNMVMGPGGQNSHGGGPPNGMPHQPHMPPQGPGGHYSPYGQPQMHGAPNMGPPPPQGYHQGYPAPYPPNPHAHHQQYPPHQYSMPPTQGAPPHNPTNYMPPPSQQQQQQPQQQPPQPQKPPQQQAPTPPPPPPPPPALPQEPQQSSQSAVSQSAEMSDSCIDEQQPPPKKRKTNTVKRSTSQVGPGRPRKNPEANQPSSEAGPVPSLTRTASEPVRSKKSAKTPSSVPTPSPALSIVEPVRQSSARERDTSKAPPSAPSSSHPTPASQPSPDVPTPECPTSPPGNIETLESSERRRSLLDAASSLLPPVDLAKDDNIVLTPIYSEHENTHTPDDNSDIDSLFIGSSPPPTITEEPELEDDLNPFGPGTTSPIVEENTRSPIDGGDRISQTSQQLHKALSRGNSPDGVEESKTGASVPKKTSTSTKSAKEKRTERSETSAGKMNSGIGASKSKEGKAPEIAVDGVAADKPPVVKKRGRGRPPLSSLNSDPTRHSDAAAPPSDAALTSDAIGPPTDGAPEVVKRKRGRIPGSKKNPADKAPRGKYITKERIERQMRAKIAAGELPNFCEHCGAIETPTWRKAKVKRPDPETGEEKEVEVQLCNPCGLWEKNHGTMRPEKYWENPANDQPRPTRKPRVKKKKPANPSQEDGSIPSDPADFSNRESMLPPSSTSGLRSKTGRPSTPEPVRSENREWAQAINKSLRRIQSSPAVPMGTAGDPINLVSPGSALKTRRVLFPDAKRSSKGIDGKDDAESEEAIDKENRPPSEIDEMDWEEEFAKALQDANTNEKELGDFENVEEGTERPTTPIPQLSGATEFKTPVKFTPGLGALATGSPSPWRSSIFANFTPGQLLTTPNGKVFGTPSKLMSPASGEIMLELINEWTKSNDPNTSPRTREAMNMTDDIFTDLDFSALGESLLTSDQPMPSSPPPLFAVYDEARSGVDGTSSLWSDIIPTSPGPNVNTYSLDISGQGIDGKALSAVTEELDTTGLDLDGNLIVDFSDFVAVAPKTAAASTTPGTTVTEKLNAEAPKESSGGEKSSSEDD